MSRAAISIAAPRPDLVPRPHLIRRLDQSLRPGNRLRLISALADFGKTTLLSASRASPAGRDYPLAWLSLGYSSGRASHVVAVTLPPDGCERPRRAGGQKAWSQ